MSDGERSEALQRLDQQRARLSGRVQAPAWYLACFGATLALLLAAPFGSHYLRWGGGLSILLAMGVFFVLQAGFARASGLAIGTRTLRYPSGRIAGITLVAACVGAIQAETVLLHHSEGGDAVGVGILAVAIGVVCWQAHLRGIRRDLRSGIGHE